MLIELQPKTGRKQKRFRKQIRGANALSLPAVSPPFVPYWQNLTGKACRQSIPSGCRVLDLESQTKTER